MIKHILTMTGVLAIAFSAVAHAAPEGAENAKKSKASAVQAVAGAEVKAVQKGDKVTITWTLPKGDWRVINLSRNGQEKTKGRVKIKAVNPNKAKSYVDTVPDASKQYWYWFSASRTGEGNVEIGPIPVTK
ncbi:hypothetical protein OH491_01365 [Termitidicoccus mucosus]|uniref:Fibronectin type-III domain-containing protein n=1 Tax=Termitidicoccus mucosus TaxID=1184151 RepID=A0A178IKQ1_9BACT|nr:hypothetical protein AW736_08180 [Opitutaceae bacterium TSB47]